MTSIEEYRALIDKLVKENRTAELQDIITSRMLNWLEKHQGANEVEMRVAMNNIFGKNIDPYIKRSLDRFRELHREMNDLYSTLGVKLPFEADTLTSLRVVTQMRYGAFKDAQLSQLKRDLARGLADNVGLDELKRRVKAAGGRIAMYGDTIACTQYAGYGQAMKNEKANIAGVLSFEYVGNLRVTSRMFCQKHLGKIYTKEEINKLDTDPDLGRAGIRPVALYKGGWNCAHDWEPVL